MNRIAASLVLLGAVAHADGNRVEVAVGKTVERNVGYVRGWFCDNPELIRGNLVTRGKPPDDANFWIVTGVKPGTTQCRVGLDVHSPHLVFDVIVVANRG